MKKINSFLLEWDWLSSLIFASLLTLSFYGLTYDIEGQKELRPILYALYKDYIAYLLIPTLFVSSALIFYMAYLKKASQPTILSLKKELAEVKHRNEIFSQSVNSFFEGYLYHLAKKLEFGKMGKNCERISLYVHDKKSSFVLCGRYSANPNFAKKRRSSYPDHEGCIAKGWANGWIFDNGSPSYEDNRDRYLDYHLQNFGMPRNTTKPISMKSRLFAVMAIKNNGTNLAVIVLESTCEKRFSEDYLKENLSQEREYLDDIVFRLKDNIPHPDLTRNMGL